MLPNINPTKTKAWSKLLIKKESLSKKTILSLFEQDSKRASKFSAQVENLYLDYSKNLIDNETLNILGELLEECQLKKAIDMMFSGQPINETENRSVLHIALRNKVNNPIFVEGNDIMPSIQAVKIKMKNFCDAVISKEWLGCTNKPITDIVNIGIGGSDLGPMMVCEALQYFNTGLNMHFVSNVDATHIKETLKKVNVGTTLFLIASKTFTTQETMANANTAKDYFLKELGDKAIIAKHFVAISTNKTEVAKFGIDVNNMFEFWDWVGGRFSLTSAIGLSIALSIGYDRFEQLLDGCNAMDNHFRSTEWNNNLPILLAIIGIWNTNFLGAQSLAILPYDQYLHRFAAYLQQADMESNGKSIDRSGLKVNYQTGPIIWGEPGTNGQHAFFQLIHQGTKLIPCDFIVAAKSHHNEVNHHTLLLANCFAQAKALMEGKSQSKVIEECKRKGLTEAEYSKLVPYKVFEGNKPSNMILAKEIDPYTLGMIIAMYEHKIFVQGIIWNIFSFDQWGVELGKELASNIIPVLNNNESSFNLDQSTQALVSKAQNWSN